ncbi:RadC family protein [Oleiharenicola lentus]|uniref:RadC family protein n=1 Tax=Oleiharenicola lentus TaxID=2508720 RepID=UPI003F6622CF
MSNETYQPLRLKDLAVNDRPQERLARLGAGSLSDTELLAMLIRSGQKGRNVVQLSQALIAEAGSLSGLTRWSETDFRKIKGIGPVKALQLLAVMEIARRVVAAERELTPILNRPELVFEHFRPLIADLIVEKFWTLCLSRKNRLIKLVEVTSGTATASLAHPREVYREAIAQGSTAIICVHNHPSGDPAPSTADIQVTRQLREAAKTVDIDLLDHVIIGSVKTDPLGLGYYSFREAGLI